MIVFRRLPIRYIRSFTERKQEEEMKKQKEEFKRMIDELSRKEVYTLKDFKKEMFGMSKKKNSIFRKIFSEAQPEEIKLEKDKKILNAIKEEELVGTVPVNSDIKNEIAQVSQNTIEDVNEIFRHFKIQEKLHSYLKNRREKGEYIPQTNEELQNMLRTDRPSMTKEEKFKYKRKFSNQQRKWIGAMK